jgi:hypothetical protein
MYVMYMYVCKEWARVRPALALFPTRSVVLSTASNHPYVVTVTLPMSEGRTSEAWEPSTKMMLFTPLP